MPSVLQCPACKEKVAIPDGLADHAMLRCPLCQAQFALSDVASDAVAAPIVVVLDEPAPAVAVEPEDRLPAEVDSLRAKAEAFAGSADSSDADPKNLQDQADALGQEAEMVLAQVGQLTAEARQAETAASALVAKAQGHRKNAGGAIGALADALDAVARAFDEKCEALQAQLPGETPAVEEEAKQEVVEETSASEPANDEPNPFAFLGQKPAAEEKPEPTADEPVAVEEPKAPAEEPKADDQASDSFAFLKQLEPSHEEKAAAESEEKPEPEETGLSVEETDMNSFLAGIDAATKGEPEPSASDAEATPEESLLPASDSGAVQETTETPASEASAEPAEQGTESPAAEEASPTVAETPTVDFEAVRAQLETFRAAASVLKAKAAQLREEASSLVDQTSEYALQETTAGGEGGSPWQTQGGDSAAGVFSLDAGANAGTPGRTIRPGRRRKETNPIKELIGIVVGGACGLLIAYYGLNIFGGARYDFAKLYLPGVAHTVKHRPAWWPKWARFEGGAATQEDASLEQPGQESPVFEPAAAVAPKPAKPAKKPAKAAAKPAKAARPAKKVVQEPPELPTPLDLGTMSESPDTSNASNALDMLPPTDLTVPSGLSVPTPEAAKETKPAPKPETKPASKPEVKPEAAKEAKPAPKPEAKPAAKAEAKPEAAKEAKPAPK